MKYDAIVVVGGSAGVGAAVSAARNGAIIGGRNIWPYFTGIN